MGWLKLKLRPSFYLGAVAWAAAVIAMVGIIALATGDEDDYGGLVLVPIFGVALYLIARDVAGVIRRRRVAIVLGHVEQAVRLNLPLPQMMLAAADSESRKVRSRLLALHDRLDRGEPLGQALYYTLPELPASSARAIAAGEAIGALPAALDRLVKRSMPGDRYRPPLDRFYRGYAIFLTVFGLSMVLGLLEIVVFPKFTSILHSFNQPMPWATQWVIALCNSPIPIAVAGLILLLACLPWSGAAHDYVWQFIPIAGGAARDRGLADLCAFLADATENGRPLDAALDQAAQGQPNAILRRKVRNWAAAAAAGQTPRDAARRAGMPALIAGMLAGGGDSTQVFTFLARHYEYRLDRARELMRAAAVPAFVFSMGAIVLLADLAVFQPMIALINGLATPGHHAGGF